MIWGRSSIPRRRLINSAVISARAFVIDCSVPTPILMSAIEAQTNFGYVVLRYNFDIGELTVNSAQLFLQSTI